MSEQNIEKTTRPVPEDKPSPRSVMLHRAGFGSYTAVNSRGGELTMGTGDGSDFTPVELLLAAIAGCASVDVDYITSKRAEPVSMAAVSSGNKCKAGGEGFMDDLRVDFSVVFPEGPQGDAARAVLDQAIQMSQDRLCTVSRTVTRGTPVRMGRAPERP